mmetsp:Transcript_53316/g.165625  ORF Transcript_53316/g.165625 Transcript_53316/m.165625 type:complete len:868 (+) Transcript_53316:260-2863(+)
MARAAATPTRLPGPGSLLPRSVTSAAEQRCSRPSPPGQRSSAPSALHRRGVCTAVGCRSCCADARARAARGAAPRGAWGSGGSVDVVDLTWGQDPTVVDLEGGPPRGVQELLAHQRVLLVGDAADPVHLIPARVPEEVQAAAKPLDLALEQLAAGGLHGNLPRRKVAGGQEVAEGDDLARAPALLPHLLDAPDKRLVPTQEELVRALLAHGPLAEGVVLLATRPWVGAAEPTRPPREEWSNEDVLHDLGRHHLHSQTVAEVDQSQKLLHGVSELPPQGVIGVWPDPQIVVARHIEHTPKLALEDRQAALDRTEGVPEAGREQDVVGKLRGGEALRPGHGADRLVQVHPGDGEDAARAPRPAVVLREPPHPPQREGRLQGREPPEGLQRVPHGLGLTAREVPGVEVRLVAQLGMALAKKRARSPEVRLEPAWAEARGLPGVRQREVPPPQLCEHRGAAGTTDGETVLQTDGRAGEGPQERDRHGVEDHRSGQVANLHRLGPLGPLALCICLPAGRVQVLGKLISGMPQPYDAALFHRVKLQGLDVGALRLCAAPQIQKAKCLPGVCRGPVRPEDQGLVGLREGLVVVLLSGVRRSEVRADRALQLGIALRILQSGAVEADGLLHLALSEGRVAPTLLRASLRREEHQVLRLHSHALARAVQLDLEAARGALPQGHRAPAAIEVGAATQPRDLHPAAPRQRCLGPLIRDGVLDVCLHRGLRGVLWAPLHATGQSSVLLKGQTGLAVVPDLAALLLHLQRWDLHQQRRLALHVVAPKVLRSGRERSRRRCTRLSRGAAVPLRRNGEGLDICGVLLAQVLVDEVGPLEHLRAEAALVLGASQNLAKVLDGLRPRCSPRRLGGCRRCCGGLG